MACRPSTPLTSLAQSVASVDAVKGAASLATTGVIMTIAAASTAMASPERTVEEAASQPANITVTTGDLRVAAASNPVVTTPDTQWAADEISVTVTQEEPAVVASTQTSRTGTRAATPTNDTPSVAALSSAPATGAAAAAATGGSSVEGGSVLDVAMRYQGVPYRYGGTTPGGFDCSGFVGYVYGQMGVNLPRTSWAQGNAGTKVSAGEAQVGDIVAYGSHVGIYAGDGQMIHSPRPGESVKVVPIYGNPSYVRVAE